MNRVLAAATALLAALLMMTACTPEETPVESSSAAVDYPEWLERVYPAPGAELSVTQAVQVNHGVVTSERAVRLVIDGVDVTTYADQDSPGLLEYDPDDIQAQPPVELEPGEHSAVAELLDVRPATDPGGLGYEVLGTIDTFSWTFTIL